jgi:hypothetical protein
MYCSGCGQALAPGQPVCTQCGRQVAPMTPPVPGFQFQLESYAGKVRLLGYLWIAWAILSFVMGVAALAFAKTLLAGGFDHWGHPMPPIWVFPMAMHFAWLFLFGRSVLCAIAGWGLLQHEPWGRVMAIVVAILSLIKIPFGTVLGIATLVLLLGYRNSTLYEQLG